MIENQLVDSLEDNNESLFAGTISTDGMREFVFYTSNPDAVVTKFEGLKKNTTSHELQLMIQVDKGWLTYKNMLE